VALALVPFSGGGGALWLIGWRVVQGVGGAMLFANSTAILTDAFPAHQRGMALGTNQVSAIAGSFLGLVLGGVLAEWDWRAVFWVSVPIAVVGAIWSYRSLHELGERLAGKIDWWGNVTFAIGLGVLLAGIVYGINPYGGHPTGWTNPWVLTAVIGGVVVLAAFCVLETKIAQPMFHIELFKGRLFALGSLAGLMTSIGRGGLQFMLIIWLQGIWLPLHGYNFEQTPLWAGIYLLPLTVGFLVAGPVSGMLSDRFGVRAFATVGLLLVAVSMVALMLIPVDFPYWLFAAVLVLNGIGSGLFTAPNTSAVMGAVPANQRGAASGMRATFFNSGSALSIGIFFTFMIVGLAGTLPGALSSGLRAQGVPGAVADQVAGLPPVGSLFAAFLGFNPIQELLAPSGVLAHLPAANVATLTGTEFFPRLISGPFQHGLFAAFLAALVLTLIGALASALQGKGATVELEIPVSAPAPGPDAMPVPTPTNLVAAHSADEPASNGHRNGDASPDRGSMKDRLLGVLLADPARALHAVGDLDSSKGELAQLRESIEQQREQLAGAARRLREAGLTGAQIARLAGGSNRELADLLGEGTNGSTPNLAAVEACPTGAQWADPHAAERSTSPN
jgi:MFS family permease